MGPSCKPATACVVVGAGEESGLLLLPLEAFDSPRHTPMVQMRREPGQLLEGKVLSCWREEVRRSARRLRRFHAWSPPMDRPVGTTSRLAVTLGGYARRLRLAVTPGG